MSSYNSINRVVLLRNGFVMILQRKGIESLRRLRAVRGRAAVSISEQTPISSYSDCPLALSSGGTRYTSVRWSGTSTSQWRLCDRLRRTRYWGSRRNSGSQVRKWTSLGRLPCNCLRADIWQPLVDTRHYLPVANIGDRRRFEKSSVTIG